MQYHIIVILQELYYTALEKQEMPLAELSLKKAELLIKGVNEFVKQV